MRRRLDSPVVDADYTVVEPGEAQHGAPPPPPQNDNGAPTEEQLREQMRAQAANNSRNARILRYFGFALVVTAVVGTLIIGSMSRKDVSKVEVPALTAKQIEAARDPYVNSSVTAPVEHWSEQVRIPANRCVTFSPMPAADTFKIQVYWNETWRNYAYGAQVDASHVRLQSNTGKPLGVTVKFPPAGSC